MKLSIAALMAIFACIHAVWYFNIGNLGQEPLFQQFTMLGGYVLAGVAGILVIVQLVMKHIPVKLLLAVVFAACGLFTLVGMLLLLKAMPWLEHMGHGFNNPTNQLVITVLTFFGFAALFFALHMTDRYLAFEAAETAKATRYRVL